MSKQTLAIHMEKFKPKELGYIMWALNHQNRLGYQVHLGMLPFVNVHDVLVTLELLSGSGVEEHRIGREVIQKLRGCYSIGTHDTWTMYLNNKKVVRRFGAHPERGHKIPMAPKKRVTVGIRWSLPKRDFEPDDDVLVAPHVILRPTFKKGCWYVTCEKRHRNHVTNFLLNHCS